MTKLIDIIGQKYGKLTVLCREKNGGNTTRWKVRCECGNETIAQKGNLLNGHTRSCGCLKRLSKPLYERILDRTYVTDYCWEWQGRKNSNGYGWLVAIEVKGQRSNRVQLAHRAMWVAIHGSIPD